ncbi:MAG TPA: type II toxin-antitoxin system VapB family antitoxin [Candidatus Acidoferrales bacterium]|nr:type II toxin-antitoxin system VapB family antitoxin [Candidatus Acidoferrales bacterium]
MPLSIKNPQTERLARQVARETGESLTEAIEHALEERLARLKSRRRKGTLAERVEDILRRVDKLPVLDARSADEIIGYDKDGLPR